MPDDHSEVVPLLPIPNRTVKRFCADDSADSRVKVGHRQAIKPETPSRKIGRFFFALAARKMYQYKTANQVCSVDRLAIKNGRGKA